MSDKPAVGSVMLAKQRWQVFNDDYDVMPDNQSRELSSFKKNLKPWAVLRSGQVLNDNFVTHAEAIEFATSKAAAE